MIDLQTQRYALFALLAAALFGVSAPVAKLLGTGASPVMLAALLYLGSGTGLLLWRIASRRLTSSRSTEANLGRADWPWLIAAITCGGVIAPILLVWGLRSTAGATASLMLGFEGVLTALAAAILFREAVARRIWLAMAMMLAASAALAFSVSGAFAISPGMAGIFGACAFWALDNNLTRKVSAADPTLTAMLKGLGAGTFNLALALSLGESLPRLPVVATALALGMASYGASLVLFILALRHLGSARTSAHFGTAPFFGAVVAVWLFGDPLTLQLFVAIVLTALASWLVLTERHGHGHRHEALEHDHQHVHDDHHQHAHAFDWDGTQPHAHRHRHQPLTHSHPHLPDLHHRHEH
jgi:drug/metabolite transporter (DMT)-like permease